MTPKPGWKTTEFWITVLNAVGQITAAAAGAIPDKYAAVLIAAGAIAYKLSRGLAKAGTK